MSQGQRFAVSNGEQRPGRSHGLEPACGAAVKPQLRRTSGPDDLDIAPEHALRMACAQRLHGRFFCRESARKMRCWIPTTCGVGDFARREDAIQKAFAVALDREFNTIDFGRVEPKTDDVHTGWTVSDKGR
jgi:hypothetical protein